MTCTGFPCALRAAIEAGRLWLAWLMVAGAAAAAEAPGALVSESYRVQPTDILIIDVVNEAQLAAKEFRVTAGGDISYPFIGAVKAGGRTPLEIQNEVKRLLETDYLVSAQVLVQVREFRKQQISVFGQVNRPGLYELPPERRMTVMEAIALAQGLTRLARSSDIQLTRQGQTEPLRFSLEDLRKPEKVVYVEPGDVIFVPESRI